MLATVTRYTNSIYTNYTEPAIEWSKNHKTLVSTIAFSILFGAACYVSPTILFLTQKNIKFLSIIVPIAYTSTFPLVTFCLGFSSIRTSQHEEFFKIYCHSIIKAWEVWFTYVGIAF